MITVKLKGGLGNQMFEYAALRALCLEKNQDGCLSTNGLTNNGHEIFALDHFNIDKHLMVKNIKYNKIENILFKLYEKFMANYKISFYVIYIFNYICNLFGFYFIPDGYSKFHFSFTKNIRMLGYFQSDKYFKKYEKIIKKELRVKESILKINENIMKKINDNNSVCLHIRRGDFINSIHQICDNNYYEQAIDLMNKKIENPVYFVFSDDIEWIKNNLKINGKVIYVDNSNPAYEDLRLMYNCKNFIMSNSSFSWWAQYLSNNEDKVVIAPYRWYRSNIKCDIYQNNWIVLKK